MDNRLCWFWWLKAADKNGAGNCVDNTNANDRLISWQYWQNTDYTTDYTDKNGANDSGSWCSNVDQSSTISIIGQDYEH